MIRKLSTCLFLTAQLALGSFALAQNIEPIYSSAEQRSYAPENLEIAQRGLDLFQNEYRYQDALDQFDLLLSRSNLNPFEISNTNYFKAIVLKKLRRPDDVLAAYEASIAARGLLEKELESTKHEVDALLQAKGLPKKYFLPLPKSTLTPLSRIPAEIPKKFLRGNYSGYCTVLFDLNESGQPVNVTTTFCTDPILKQPSIDSVREWRYPAYNRDHAKTDRTNIKPRVIFELKDEAGNVLPYPF